MESFSWVFLVTVRIRQGSSFAQPRRADDLYGARMQMRIQGSVDLGDRTCEKGQKETG
jgi:hypothetical protein